MDRKEAIAIIKMNYPHVGISGSQFESALRELIPELNESEDEKIRKSVIGFLKTIASLKDGKTVSNKDFDSKVLLEWASYLERQKGQEPTNSEKPKEWSEEDEEKIVEIKIALYEQYDDDKAEDLYYYFLEPILYKTDTQSQQGWKPSEEQMKALENCVNGWQDSADGVLESLYSDLKKLL